MEEKTINTEKQEKSSKVRSQQKRVKLTDDVKVRVKSNYYGTLMFTPKSTGSTVVWRTPGEVQTLKISDLREMRIRCSSVFKNQWVVILGVALYEECDATAEDICKALEVEDFYKNFIEPTDFVELCNVNETELAERIKMLTPGARSNLIVALNSYIKNGTLDSLKRIKLFEKLLECELYKNEE